MKDKLECPVDFVLINENKARVTAFFVLVLGFIFLLTSIWLIPAFLIIDFTLRATKLGKFSLLGILTDVLIKQFKITYKPTDRAPKRFAAGVGLVFTTLMLAAFFLGFNIVTIILTCTLVLFAFLESFLGFCAGCYVYSFLKRFNKQ